MKANFKVSRRYSRAFPGGSVVKNPPANAGETEDPLKEEMATHLPGKSSGQKSLLGYSLWGCKESNTTERVKHAHTHRWYSNYSTKRNETTKLSQEGW